jgi:hypothetical protein
MPLQVLCSQFWQALDLPILWLVSPPYPYPKEMESMCWHFPLVPMTSPPFRRTKGREYTFLLNFAQRRNQ